MWNHQPSQIPPPQQQPEQQPPMQAQPASSDEIRTLWIGDLQFWMDENFLQNCFQATGELVSAKVIRNKLTSQSEGYGFIEFATHAAAEHVLQTYNGHMMPTAEQTFRLNWAPAGERRGDDGPDYTIYVGDLAADVTDYLLHETFKRQYPSVKGAKIVTDRTIGCSKGYGFVRFGDLDEQTRAMTEMDGVYCSSRPMRVGPATTKKNIGAQPTTKDSGKSTTGGQILLLSGQDDDRTIQKYEKDAKDKNRESWYMPYIMDTNEEERAMGITVEVGRAHFETENTRFTILDAPGHKSYVPNLISGASQADVGVLVISARKGEFETGYEKGGQTCEHAQLAKTLGVTKLVVVVNKMDDTTVGWSKERYDEIEGKMVPFLKSSGYDVKKDVQFLSISGSVGTNIKARADKKVRSWWNGPCLFEVLDTIEVPQRDPKGPLRMPIIDKYKDMGTVVMGKIESGSIREGDSLLVMPNKAHVKVLGIQCDENKVRRAGPGENVRVKLSGIDDDDILSGFVLSCVASPIGGVLEFEAQLQILELLDDAIFTAGYEAVLHIHAIVEECEIVDLLEKIDLKKKKDADPKKRRRKPLFVKNGAVVECRIQVKNLICIENFSDFAQLGRFTLCTEGKTIAVGKVVGLPPSGNARFA